METNPNPNSPVTEQTARDFLNAELAAARKSAKRTRIGSLCAMGFVACYMTFLVVTLHTRLLQPQPAAQIISSYAVNTIDANIENLDRYVRTEVPRTMRSVPDVLLERLPVIRTTIETQLEQALYNSSSELAKGLGEHLDSFVSENDEALRLFFSKAHDPAFVTEFGDGLEEQLRALLQHEFESGRTVHENIKDGLQALTQLETRLDRLANGKDLSPHEQRLKQVIAVSMQLTDQTL